MSTATGLFPVKTWTPSSSTTPSSSLDALNEAIRARVQARKSAAASGQGPAKRQRAAATAPTLPRNASSRKGGRISASSRKPPPKSIERSVGAFTSLLAARDLLSSGRHRKEPKPVVVESASSSESSSEEEEVEEAVPAKTAESAAVRAAAELAAEWGLLPELVDVVRQQNLATFFPIQRLAIRPIVNDGVRDVCVAAPTGSGKTLVYVTCVLNSLARRVVVRTRALIVVPTRDLARQAHAVFTTWATALAEAQAKTHFAEGEEQPQPLRVKLLIGQSAFETEQKRLVRRNAWGVLEAAADIVIATPGRLVDHLTSTEGFTLEHLEWLVVDEADRLMSQNYQGWIERVMRASGRRAVGGGVGLADPLRSATREAHCDAAPVAVATWRPHWQRTVFGESVDALVENALQGYGAYAATQDEAAAFATETETDDAPPLRLVMQRTPLRRMLLSATLTQNPEKLSEFALVNPMRFSVNKRNFREGGEAPAARAADAPSVALERRFVTPSRLDEHMVVCSKGQKPLMLLYLLHAIHRDGQLLRARDAEEAAAVAALAAQTRRSDDDDDDAAAAAAEKKEGESPLTMVFAGSVESAHRLARLLQLYGEPSVAFGSTPSKKAWRVREFSSAVSQKERNSVISEMERGIVSVLVCSDSLARGIDLVHISTVINYDAPTAAKTYVHRAGRTARAGRRGTVCTLLLRKQVWKFKSILTEVDNNYVSHLHLPVERTVPLVPRFVRCLDSLRRVLMREKHGKLRRNLMVRAIARVIADAAGGGGSGDAESKLVHDNAVERETRSAWE